MNPVVVRGIGEAIEGLSLIIQSQVQPIGMPLNEEKALLQAIFYLKASKVYLSIAVDSCSSNKLEQSRY